MIHLTRRKGESIDALLKRYKGKLRDSKLITEFKNKKEYEKPKTKRRKQKLKAIYTDMKKREKN